MASQKQIDANRLNAQKSTGPRTPETKAKSRRNAIRDNLTGQITTLSDEERPIFEKLKAEHIAALAPANLTEMKLAHSIAWDTWRLDHLRSIEMGIYTLAAEEAAWSAEGAAEASDPPDLLDAALTDARTFRSESKRLELMSLYEQRMNRSLHRNLAVLRDLQAERKRNRERDKKDEIAIARLHEYNNMPYKATTRPSPNGFLFSDEEIAIGTVRERYIDTAKRMTKDAHPANLCGTLRVGDGDSYLRPLSMASKIDVVPLETLAIRRQNHPEEFYPTKQ